VSCQKKLFVVIGLSLGICPQVRCFKKWKDAKAHSKRLAKEMDFHKEDYCPRTGNWHNDKNDIWIEEAELR
jgi:hypothetical protein